MYELIRLSQIDSNPYRDVNRNPLRQERIDELIASIKSTDFWDGIPVRPHPEKRGRYQLAFGHARLLAAKQTGLKEAYFNVTDMSDAMMIRRMAQENERQLGKDTFAVHMEAVVAAACHIMDAVLTDPSCAQKFLGTGLRDNGRREATKLSDEIHNGDCPGEKVLAEFLEGALSLGAIRTALQTFHDTGELTEWHKQHNPHYKAPVELPRRLNAKAIAKFDQTSHVKTFADAVKHNNVPAEQQEEIANDVVKRLRPKMPGSRSHGYPGKPDERMTAQNIRREVRQAVGRRATTSAAQRQADRFAAMSSFEEHLTNIESGLNRAESGFRGIERQIAVFGQLDITDMTELARLKLKDIRDHLVAIQKSLDASLAVFPKLGEELPSRLFVN